ncbi:MAG: UUP1 family membrane protein [Pseudomonadota bacterium]
MKSNAFHAIALAVFLIAIGASIFFVKTVRLDYPLQPGTKASVWTIEVFLDFMAKDEPARIDLFIPTADAARDVSGEEFYNGSFGLNLMNEPGAGNRKAVWSYRFPSNRKVLRYSAQTRGETASTPLPDWFAASAPRSTPFEADPVKRQAFIVWTASLRRRSADDATFADLMLREIFGGPADRGEDADEQAVLLKDLAPPLDRLELARETLAAQGLQARIANGVRLIEDIRRAETIHWLEYRVAGEDRRFFPGGAPARFLTIWRGVDGLVTANGVSELDLQIAISSQRSSAAALAQEAGARAEPLARLFSFGDLPLTTQLVYKTLVTIPVGITLLVFLRQFVGVQTLGTFMPVLIGIAFRETALLNGVILFTTLIAMGLAVRFYLERLQLLLVPRLAVVLIFIVIAMAGITILMTDNNQAIGLSISLFPMVIITMTIERMSILWEESSAGEAIKQGVGSLVVASLAYLAMSNAHVEYLMYNFPELLFLLMGTCVLMGRYTGLRLSEVWRFRQLARA